MELILPCASKLWQKAAISFSLAPRSPRHDFNLPIPIKPFSLASTSPLSCGVLCLHALPNSSFENAYTLTSKDRKKNTKPESRLSVILWYCGTVILPDVKSAQRVFCKQVAKFSRLPAFDQVLRYRSSLIGFFLFGWFVVCAGAE